MNEAVPTFEVAGEADAGELFALGLDGFEGPLDLLLELARAQKVDLARLSMAALADQYLAYVETARGRLDLAGEYLVMAAWLALLKSRLLLPKPERPRDEPDAESLAERLRDKLRRAEAIQAAAKALFALPQLGAQTFAFGAPTPPRAPGAPAYSSSLHDLLSAYCAARARAFKPQHKIAQRRVYTLEAARRRLEAALAQLADWRPMDTLRPIGMAEAGAPSAASYTASLLGASLELVRDQKLEVRQASQDAPLMLRRKVVG